MRKFAICFALLTCGQNCCADENDDRAEEYVHNLRGLAGSVTRDETKTNRPIIAVDLICTVASDETLRVLVPRLKHIEKLNLDSTQITDAGLKELAALQTLTSLSFSGTQITDAGLKALSALKKLTDLHLAGTQVTDAGVKELAAIPNLAELELGGTITDAGIEHLAKLTNLAALDVHGAFVSDAGMKSIAKLKS